MTPETTATPISQEQILAISQEQILAMLQTRGFESGFQASPLRNFWGILTSITGEMRQGQRGAFAVSLFNFDEVEVITSIEPYNSPAAQIEIPISSRDKSKMGYWGASVDDIINAGVDKTLDHGAPGVKNQDFLLGKRCHVVLTPGHPIPYRDEATNRWGDRPQDCWTLMEIQGEGTIATAQPSASQPAGGANSATLALAMLNGKTLQQWHQEVFNNPVVKADAKLINQIISGEFIGGLKAAGKIVEVGGVYAVT